ncbi:hypothetical protein [Motilimonas sp. KMU-193]|uniref:hypothetical protein n=1 Tax=Motilimonas sp. KMU-193 TaxID=3388668 RepID=UPI00396B3E43
MNKKAWVLGLGLLFSAASQASVDETCSEAAAKVNSVIESWHGIVVEYNAQDKNPSVLAMYEDFQAGKLEANFNTQCQQKWANNQDVFECFTGVRSEMGAAMCTHPDTNKNDWQY